MQTGSTEFIFSMTEIPPQCLYGDNPELDRIGAVSHLLPTYKWDDQEAIDWIIENDIEYQVKTTSEFRKRFIIFSNIEDAMAFKLRWL